MNTNQADRPLPNDFAMFSKAGNNAAKAIVAAVLKLPMDTTDQELYAFMTERMKTVAEKHGEIWDTDVREAMIGCIEHRTGRELTIYI